MKSVSGFEVVLDADDAPVPSAEGSEVAREHAAVMVRTAIATAVVVRRALVIAAA